MSNIILAALLYPEVFGIMALATVVMIGLNMLSDAGIHYSIIQNKKGEEGSFRHTAWTLQIIRGFLIWGISCVIAYPIAQLYATPVLFPVICALGFMEVVRGFQTTALSVNTKNLNIGKVSILKVGTQALGIIIMLAWTKIDPSVWALVWGTMIATITSIPFGHWFLNQGFKHQLKIEKSAFGELFGLGKWIFLSSVVGFVANQADRLIIGKVLSISELGLYSIALALAQIPWMIFNKLSTQVLLPIYAEIQDQDLSEVRKKLAKIRIRVAALLLPPAMCLIIYGEELIQLMYDDRYLEAGWMLETLACGVALTVATNIGPVYLGFGKPKVFLMSVIFKGIFLVGSMALGNYYLGTKGMIYGVALSHALYYLLQVGIYSYFKLWLWRMDIAILSMLSSIYLLAL